MKVNFHWLAFDWPKRQKNNINIFALAGLSHRARPSPFLAVYFFVVSKKNRFTFFSLLLLLSVQGFNRLLPQK